MGREEGRGGGRREGLCRPASSLQYRCAVLCTLSCVSLHFFNRLTLGHRLPSSLDLHSYTGLRFLKKSDSTKRV